MSIDLSEGKPVRVVFTPPLTPELTKEFQATFKTIGPSGPGCGPRVDAAYAGDNTPRYKEGRFKLVDIVTGAIAPRVKTFLDQRNVSYQTEDLLPHYTKLFLRHARGEDEAQKMAAKHIAEHNLAEYPMNDHGAGADQKHLDSLS